MSSKSLLGAAAALGLVLSGVALAQSQGQGGASDGDRFLDVIVILDPAFAPGAHAANRAAPRGLARRRGGGARWR